MNTIQRASPARNQFLTSTVLGLVLLIAALILWPVYRVRRLTNAFSRVKQNDARDPVLKHIGKPWKDEECGKYLGGVPTGCAEEFIYAHPYAPYVPEYWVIDFSSSHRVISKVQLISP